MNNDDRAEMIWIDQDVVVCMMLHCERILRDRRVHPDDGDILQLCVNTAKRLVEYPE